MRKSRDWIEGAGLAVLLLLPYCYKFLLFDNIVLYHLHLPIVHRMNGLLLDFIVYALLGGALLSTIRRLPEFASRLMEAAYAATVVWLAVDLALLVLAQRLTAYRTAEVTAVWNDSALALVLLSIALSWRWTAQTQVAVRVVRLAVAGLAFSGLWIVPQLVRIARAHPSLETAALLTPQATKPHPRRIVWILFDELSYKQVFEHPYPGIAVPNFDRVAAESVTFRNLRPEGFFTDKILPYLFLGDHIDEIRSDIDGQLLFMDEHQRRWRFYGAETTVFGLARKQGWNTGISGWYNPYCRLLGKLTADCFWEANQTLSESYGTSEDSSPLRNATLFPNRLLEPFRRHTTPLEDHVRICASILSQADRLIADDRLQFIFVHIPVPHAPATYDRRTHRARLGGTYLDSVVEADDMLGVIQSSIASSTQRAETTLIISSDHSWRTHIGNDGRRGQSESQEEFSASGGRFDDRPVLLIHFSGQRARDEVSGPVAEMMEHDLLTEMLEDRMERVEDFDKFYAGRTH